MGTLQEAMLEYRRQLEKGTIQKAYQGLVQYIMNLKTYFNNQHPEYSTAGALYHGYMDMTYFPLFPEALKERKLKIAIVFNYEQFRFEIWLSGFNKQVQSDYYKLFKESGWKQYHIVAPEKGIDSIVESTLVEDPDFDDLDGLTRKIEKAVVKFIEDIEGFLETRG